MMAQVCAWACCSAGGAPSARVGERRSPSVVGLGWSLKAGFMGFAGWVGGSGDAVNPSLGAWPRHPCRGHPRPAYPPGPGQVPAASTTENHKQEQKRVASLTKPRPPAIRRCRCFCFCLFFLIFPWWIGNRNLSGAGRVGVAGYPRHGPEACLGRVGQDAQPRSCRVRRTARTSKPRLSPHGRVVVVKYFWTLPKGVQATCSSQSAGGTRPLALCGRRWLYQSTNCSMSAAASCRVGYLE